ncbi:uncharacterized protein LOC131253327 [Magnolia sinica]|uniref:uncharacterized protein LOC131253327 n=1 Tax=Magnolia sinica TaxID=86752 RepID=UPI00265A1849|nr:uncharacterized protein LOC131253327 [Magnolia sinica]XP_058110271.1 uncharacterized protein LOC131253327 [Magnolia sinica]
MNFHSFNPMFHFISIRRKRHIPITTKYSTPRSLFLLFLFQQNPSSLRSFSNISTNNPTKTQATPSSFTLSYLINSCGISPHSALSASQKMELKSAQNPDSVLKFFRNHGFTKTQVTNLIAKCPRLLLADPNKTLMPKFQYFHGLGIPSATLAKILSWDYSIWNRSLQNQIIPSINFIKACVRTNERVICCIQHSTHILRYDLQKVMEPNITMLRDQGVPESRIVRLITIQPRVLMQPAERLNEIVAMVKEMGFNPSTGNFILAIQVVSRMSRLKWEQKVAVYRSLGWSEDEFLSAFKVQPICMTTSEKKIKRVMNFFVKEMDWKPSDLSRHPGILMSSLEKRIIPRCSVLQILMSKGLIKKDSIIRTALVLSNRAFLERFIIKYQEIIPKIITVYRGKMGFEGLDAMSEDAGPALKL